VINRPPQEVRFSVDLHKNLVQIPLPIRMSAQVLNQILSDLSGEQRAETVLSEPDRFMAEINPAFVEHESSTFRSDNTDRIYILTARRVITGLI